ncbi:hypothetical protein [Pseudoteredinibacter isoporae]|uniref:Uncharacterized protein n=1 Tax=Pseudoteredinibacter isoporae TaxID=570281 RepID=A0A7X0MU90_9GAMM|nr:hypothetical protein [Pseudoteredinibacter isoporae]MBB6520381.1 hypothetical protein [Pseudoteredinibacter isoporae]NHO85950.1 hypothetical protein [Pseudoteredinibacter isoporae]NIB25598.1 hypothetical protein [Pseudoteredinibacter isoporae]
MNCKQRSIVLSLLAALVSFTVKGQMHLNPDGSGQLLMYPLYTTAQANDTYLSLLNSTRDYKAVSVRVLQSHDGQSVANFYVYLSPHDHWSAVITKDPNGEGALIRTGDSSCTVPEQIAATGPNSVGAVTAFKILENGNPQYNQIGHVEVIEMGTLNFEESGTAYLNPVNDTPFLQNDQQAIEQLKSAIHHAQGLPGNCRALTNAWQPAADANNPSTAAFYYPDPDSGPGDFTRARIPLAPPSGGLSGHGIIINVPDGTAIQYEAVAVEDFMASGYHPSPGGDEPGLDDGVPSAILETSDGQQQIFLAGPLVDMESEEIKNTGNLPGDRVSLFHVKRQAGASGSRLAGGGQVIAAIKESHRSDNFHMYGDQRANDSFLSVTGGPQGLGLAGGKEALSAMLSRSMVINDYTLEPALNATTNWVVTLPTTRNFIAVNQLASENSSSEYIAQAPFEILRLRPDFPCSQFNLRYWDRESSEDVAYYANSGVLRRAFYGLCATSNIINFKTNHLGQRITESFANLDRYFSSHYRNGWARLEYTDLDLRHLTSRAGTAGQVTAGVKSLTVKGMPAIGFATQVYVNSSVGHSGTLANYGIALKHGYVSDITINE